MKQQNQKLTAIEIGTYVFVFALILVGLVISLMDEEMFEDRYAVEDGLIEWLTVLGFAIGGVVCLRRVFTLRGARPALFLIMTGLLGLAFIFIAGEEISWGQRVFDWRTGEFFASHNAQEETNLHNLRIGEVKINKLVFSNMVAVVMVLYFGLLMPFYGVKPKLAAFSDALAIPIPKIHQTIACVLMLIITQVLVPSSNRGELAEFGGAFLFTIIVSLPANDWLFRAQQQESAITAP